MNKIDNAIWPIFIPLLIAICVIKTNHDAAHKLGTRNTATVSTMAAARAPAITNNIDQPPYPPGW